jgi:lysophospholipase L1-like esterase
MTIRRALTLGSLLVTTIAADVLVLQAVLAIRRDYVPADSAPDVTGEYGHPADPTIRLVVLGDSTGAGVGVTDAVDTVGGRLASLLSQEHLHVFLSGAAVSGSRSGDIGPQVSRALLGNPDIAVLLVGANDATHGTPPGRLTPPTVGAIHRLRSAGVTVVFGTCPDLGAARAFARPLRDLVAAYGRRVAQAQAEAGRQAGALVVDLAAKTGPAFRADPQATLSTDAFHPSATGYDLWARALLPAVRDAAGIRVR